MGLGYKNSNVLFGERDKLLIRHLGTYILERDFGLRCAVRGLYMSMANFGNASKRTLEYDTSILQSAQSV